ncbi:Alpha/Beta hydrolase protein [Rhodotorula diobovata]|uniref:Carboxypeptidase n=1 Tax=Rhodotorula diobovata TaxID=5288 RepID=A0A5C5FS53_9BASI|nr:Alpha/Beta hydrolase protein [Rhodotorula diobovata]
MGSTGVRMLVYATALLGAAALAHIAAALPQAVGLPNAQAIFSPAPPTAQQRLLVGDSPFAVRTHPGVPSHRLRVKHPKGLCDPGVHQTSGYLDNDLGHHHYFWQFDSRNDPANDPIVLWLNGGPGCSSFTGLLQELGPCHARPDGQDPVYNPYSWNNNASLIFLDQPVGVGYSYADKHDEGVWTTEAAARDIYAFLQIFFDEYADKFGEVDFHIAGESYAGRYIPLFADYIRKQNEHADERGLRKINLVSTLIGNGFTDPLRQYAQYHPTVCTDQMGGPFVDERGCAKMERALPGCQSLVKACYDRPHVSALCASASAYCETRVTAPYFETGRSSYNMLKFGDYKEEKWIAQWLNRESVRHELRVDLDPHGHGVKKFVGCSDKVFEHFTLSGDQVKPSFQQVADLLDNSIATLLYVGTLDFICNWLGVADWATHLTWSRGEEFSKEPLRAWYASPELAHEGNETVRAGEFRQVGRFALAGVDGAGHFVPYDKPQEALALFNGWVMNRTVGFAASEA